MGIETAAVAMAGLQFANGVMTAKGYQKEAEYANDAIMKATKQKVDLKRLETSRTIASQKVGYLKSGVELAGSAADVLYDTFSTSEKDVNAMVNDANTQMRNNTKQATSNARAALLDGILKAGSSITSSMMSGMQSNLPTYDVTGTAGVGSNVSMTNASYMG